MNEQQSTNQSAEEKRKETGRLYGNTYRFATYLPPRYSNLFNAWVEFNDGETKSSCLEQIVKKFFDTMPEHEKQRILNYSKNSY